MKWTLVLIIAILGMFSACQTPVEGCTHPRAANFNPEADDNMGCVYYELVLDMKHTTNANDVFTYGYWLYDVDGTPFYVQKLPILLSQAHLVYANSGTEKMSPEILSVFDASGNREYTEDNFAIVAPDQDLIDMAGWVDLGDFDKLRFQVGIPSNVRKTSPARITESKHPLSTTASSYMYDSTSTSYLTSRMNIILPNTQDTLNFNFYGDWDIELPYNVTVVDGSDINIPLQVNYAALFDGISFNNDDSTTISTKIKQNMVAAFSIY